MNRLQQLNTDLLNKVKQQQNDEKFYKDEDELQPSTNKKVVEELRNLRLDKKQMVEEYKNLKVSYEELMEENSAIAQKYERLLKSSKEFEVNALELYESHQNLTEKLARYLK